MSKLKLNGSVDFMGMDIPVIEGGFGGDKKCILAKDIAEIHSRELRTVNQNINRNIKRFRDGVDIMDLKVDNFGVTLSDSGIISQNALNASKNIYLLSERGYSKLIKILDDDKAWEMHDELIDHYFSLRGQVKTSIKESHLAIIDIIEAESDLDMAMAIRNYEDVVTKPLKLEIDKYDRFLCENMDTLTKTELAQKLDTSPQTLAATLRETGVYTPKRAQVSTSFLRKFSDTKIIVDVISEYRHPRTGEMIEKKDWQWSGRGAKKVVDYLLEMDKVIFTENKGFKLV